ncbi:SusD/RagB family nutrient-binding outer membrane lipoprotein [Paraflavitalea sp. CAU 1676]|uniref:SusD/RagB family nutrient-binding outer membrane lipoprotein n=1 Tax=Paraflavitalea sp. CAU 1676 TaxID=3032598 RepID=UPI0023D9CD59|nr:SusD/RagB family nutrient-binding outer membrane lipoprotein [Paraflavitalea sp. CAU 1676]MDF2188120.1 SusD/RagB family nutrient-binding outer membrane lipoprotein [Paraflavitalea sp. CAU 1676]
MKLYKSIWVVAALAGMAGTGCQKFIDVNKNPNLATTADPALVFTNALNQTAYFAPRGGNLLGSYWSGYWGHSTSYTTGTPEKTYSFSNGDFTYWGDIFDNLNDYQLVINSADAKKVSFLKGPAKIMKALRYQELVDLYGNVPYSEAFKGIELFQPKYDKAQDVYDSLIVLLTGAIADLKANALPASLGANIFYIGGGKTSADWIKFANTLKLRILMRQSLVTARQNFIKDEIQKILTEGSGFLTEGMDVACQPGYAKTSGKLNPVYAYTGFDQNDASVQGRDLYRISKHLIDTLIASDDTVRLKYIADVAPGKRPANAPAFYQGLKEDYVGVEFGGEGDEYLAPKTSPIGPGLVVRGEGTKAQVVFTAAESYFLQAEAAERLGIAALGSSKALYEKGIRESFRLLGAPASAATELIGGSADFDAAANKIEAILYQKWVALANFNGLEAWAEYRRNDYPAVPFSVNSGQIGKKPVRLYYPQDEVATNGDVVKAQGTIDVYTSRLFWDVR